MPTLEPPTVTVYSREATIRRWALAVGPLAVAAVLAFGLRNQPTAAASGLMSMALAVLVVVLTLRWPVVGFAIALFGTALVEPFPVPGDLSTATTWVFHANLQSWTPIPLPFTIVELLLILTAVSWVLRRGQTGRLRLSMGLLGRPMLAFGACIIGGLIYGVGMAGGDGRIALWEVRALAYIVLTYFLMGVLLRSTRHIQAITWLIIIGSALNAARAVWRFVFVFDGKTLDANASISGSAHENVLFYIVLITLCLAQCTWGRWGWQRWVLLLNLPTTILALLVSQRRAAFVVLFLGFLVWAVFLFRQRQAAFWWIIPPLLVVSVVYLGIFWNSQDGVLSQPVRAVKTIMGDEVSERDESSNLYRQIEEYNIWRTIRDNPVTGIGFGRPFSIYIAMIVVQGWEFQFFTPHNQVFWIWLKMGTIGFAVTLWLFGLSIARGVQLTDRGTPDELKPFLIMATSYAIGLLTFSYVDIGLANGRATLLLGTVLGVVGHLPALLPQAARREVPAPVPVAGRLRGGSGPATRRRAAS